MINHPNRSKEIKETLERILAEHQNARSYSGQFMFGDVCVGIEANELRFLADIIIAIRDEFDEPGKFAIAINRLFNGMRADDMGLGTIYYWPSLAWIGEEE